MTRSCKNKSWGLRSPSSFTNQQMIKSPFSSQIHKMKAKSSGKKVRKYRPFPRKSQHVLDLERQLALMQERLKVVEEKLEADSTNLRQATAGPSSDCDTTEPRRSRRSRLREEDTDRASTSGRSTLKRKRRTAETDSDESEGMMTVEFVTNE